MRRWCPILVGLLLLALPACSLTHWARESTGSDPVPSERDDIWKVARKVVGKAYDINEAETDKGQGYIETYWKFDPSPDYLRTYRRQIRLEIRVHPADEDRPQKDQRFQVRIRVDQQVNDNIVDPRSRDAADWGETERDTDLERILVAEINLELRGTGDIDLPEVPRSLPPSQDGEWIQTMLAPVSMSQAWDITTRYARSKGFKDELLQPQIGRYESAWLPDDAPRIEQALRRLRFVALIVPETSKEGATFHRVQVRVEREYRQRTDDEWRAGRRDDTWEQIHALALDEQLQAAR